ncbi:enoyl-CoA hydratase/isomerase family protein [Chondromyces crocatus]|uniref:Enoyl-CoA hydratase n=1 Tax=Chondromyces crocatus TaxID=52 RepID=A0A0K1EST8_CHOCO|nr:enoyl-CoA hydratase/isomerase family protein [Chondromyces crocatus]AKT43702.1 enoyl-CoA hydratase [Chondromyces crocatus]
MPIQRTQHDSVAVLALELGRSNAINQGFIDALNGALDTLDQDPAVRGLVITGQGRAFCVGLDLMEATALDQPALERFVDAFDALFERVARFPWPVVAAVNGHAIAGGCLLAMAADYRVMAQGPYQIGVNEVALGIPLPSASFEVARRGIPAAAWPEALFQGRLYRTEEALAAGLVQKVAEQDVLAEAIAVAARLAGGAPEALKTMKADVIAPMVASVAAHREARRERFIACWNTPEARARIGRVRDQLARKASGPKEGATG